MEGTIDHYLLLRYFIFLMVSQEDTYTKLLAYVGALGAAIPHFSETIVIPG